MAITILFPEFIFSKAVCELKNAIDDLYQMKNESELNWKVEFGVVCQRLYRIFHLFDKSMDEKHKSMVVTKVAVPLQAHLDEESDNDGPPSPLDLEPTAPGIESQPTQSIAATPGEHLARGGLQNEGEDRIHNSDLRSSPNQGDTLTTESLNLLFIPFNQGGGVKGRHRDQCWTENGDVWSEEWIPWTLTHTYFANMGGFYEILDTRMYGVITASSMLTRCRGVKSDYNLFPSRQDIEDKSKADLFVKLLALSQISWLVLSVIARGISGLAVSQIEIATVAFSVLAIATYSANIWKPKDVDVPIMLRIPGTPEGLGTEKEMRVKHETRSFIGFLFQPSWLPDGHRPRIPNDTFRITGAIPLISSLTAVSTMIFGGLHCIAWSFDFPSKAEQLIWRIASVSSATVPCIALFGSLSILWLIGTRKKRCRGVLQEQLQLLDKYPAIWWSSFTKHSAIRTEFEAFLLESEAPEIYRMPPKPSGRRRGWVERSIKRQLKRSLKPHELVQLNLDIERGEKVYRIYYWDREQWDSMISALGEAHENWRSLQAGHDYDLIKPLTYIRECWERFQHSPKVASLWGKYETFVSDKLRADGCDVPMSSIVEYLLARETIIVEQNQELEDFKNQWDSVSRSLTIFAGFVYSVARVALLVIAFTSLRSAPEDLYTTSWARFMPHVS
jgi:hypothetical protein